MNVSKHLINRNVIRGNPADPREVTKRLKKIPRKKVPRGGSQERVQEELFTTEPPSIPDTGIGLCVECVEKCTRYKIGWPNWTGFQREDEQ